MTMFRDFLLDNRKEKSIRIFFDIETLQYNEALGYEKPTLFKNVVYSVAIGYYTNELNIKIYPSFKLFFDEIIETYKHWKNLPKIELIAHNTNKYDNHFLRKDLLYFYDLPIKNIYLKNATKDGNILSIKKKDIKQHHKEGIILEKRIKSSNNLELNFFINNIEFFTTDNYIKTNTSIKVLGEKLLSLKLINEDDLKTDYDYLKYNRLYDMTDDEAYKYAINVFNNLTDDELTYIKNDIIILANSVINYSKIFKGFDYNNITFTNNILKYYNDNDLSSYQLLKSVGQGKDRKHLKYTSYFFGNDNFYDYLKSFYSGGLNFYNDDLVGKVLDYKIFSMDINSSYPYAMHKFKVPTYLKDYKDYKKDTMIKINLNDDFYLYRMSKVAFDNHIIMRLESKILKQMLVKYYTKNEYININSYTIRMIENIAGIKIKELPIISFVSFESEFFASREKIAEKYKVKEQGSSKFKLHFKDPYNIKRLNEKNDLLYSDGEIDISKIILNGLYGIPALRSHFNIFRWVGNELQNIQNGYENNERNIVFSVFVTAVSLYNLLNPLSYLTQSEIDKYFIYCDTDSLYLNKNVFNKLPSKLFHPHHLGKWSIEQENINNFIVMNHKKYAYEFLCNESNEYKIQVKCGGIPNDSFDTNMSFKKFVSTQFTDNTEVKNKKSIYNKQGTISIYDSITIIKKGSGYRVFSHDPKLDELKDKMMEEIKNSHDGNIEDVLYIESNLGTFSMSDINPHKYDIKTTQSLFYLKMYEDLIINNYL